MWDRLKTLSNVCDQVELDDFVSIDEDVVITEYPDDNGILYCVSKENTQNSSDHEEEEEEDDMINKPSETEMMKAFETIRRGFQCQENVPNGIFNALSKCETYYEHKLIINRLYTYISKRFNDKMISIEACGIYTFLLAIVGEICIIFKVFDSILALLQTIRTVLEPFFLSYEPQTLSEKFGSWALVTGATDGIGKAYAKELAGRGVNIVLVSRSETKLKATAQEIEISFKVKTKIISVDFSLGPKAIEVVKSQLEDLPIGILVNNVGKQYCYPMYLEEVPEQELWDIIKINVGAVTMMTRLLVKGMKDRNRGAIVNVSSGAECQPLPLMNVYAASKVYIKYFTEALREEYAEHGVTVQHLSPFFINTKMNHFSDKLQETSLLVPDATTYAKYAVSTLGKINHSTGYWVHGIQHFFTTIPPVWIRMKIGLYLNKSFREDYFRQLKINN
ncbi:hypothetical protein RN001_007637 [Aquatica leii]|uniref:Inactive hydroxysteroid dehydrogenase-like protein 1 n=1 Tax=Aquatica leii TaxID=1421715 RepID=A0AAN7PBZ6_9COLE|nr:hypothetical protein RN001_007637 [Aquatica leii]